MKIGIVISGTLWSSPYVSIYTNILDKSNVEYDIISWNRDGQDNHNGFHYDKLINESNTILKFLDFIKYAHYVKSIIRHQKYDKLFIFDPQNAIFISRFLKKYYKRKYIFDYRDLSIEQMSCFKSAFKRVLDNSVANVISSPGFKQYLPEGYDYYLSHNFNIDIVKSAVTKDVQMAIPNKINVLTIGGIRDYESNVQVIDALANTENFNVRFVGKGPSAKSLEEHTKEIGAKNVVFEGYYPKEKEKDYINDCTFLNIFYPRKPSHDTALSNRFYNSLIYKKPMITTADTVQGNYAKEYGVGVALESCESLKYSLEQYLSSSEYKNFNHSANVLLCKFVKDYEVFNEMILNFLSHE